MPEPIRPPLDYRTIERRINNLNHQISAIKKRASPKWPAQDSGYRELVAERDRLLTQSGVTTGWDAEVRMDRLRAATAAKDAAHEAWVAAAQDAKDNHADTVDRIAEAAGFETRYGLYKLLSRNPHNRLARQGIHHQPDEDQP